MSSFENPKILMSLLVLCLTSESSLYLITIICFH